MVIPRLIVFGSIEAVYNTIGNRPVGKPFHLHLMIAGATAAQIDQAVRATIPLNEGDVAPLDIRSVGPNAADFFAAASYAFKQPLLKKSLAVAGATGVTQSLKAAERRELIQNLGVHGWTARLILVGIRCDSGRFRLTVNVSATPNDGENRCLRQRSSRSLPQASQRHQSQEGGE